MNSIVLLGRSTALAAAGSSPQLHVQSIVILCAAILSTLGALSIIISFLFFPQVRTFRHQLILGLAISDLVMALNFLSSTATNLSGRFIGASSMKSFCLFNGFMTQFFVVQTDYWVLAIAICTYFMVGDHGRASKWIQDHRYVVFSLPPLISLIWALIGLGLQAYANIGAWCWFPSDRTRLLVNFIPRWLIILGCLAVYSHLFLTIHRSHRKVAAQSESRTNLSTGFDMKEIQINQHELPTGTITTRASTRQTVRGSATSQQLSTALKKIAYQMMTYPLIYMFIWSIPTSIRIYQASTGKAAPTPVATVDKTCIVIQGFLDALVYGYNEISVGAWRAYFNRLFRARSTLHSEVDKSSIA